MVAEVLLHNPELRVFDLEVRAREARALQAGEINENGVLSERLSDQERRRRINYYGWILYERARCLRI